MNTISARIPEYEVELIHFLNTLRKGETSKIIIDALKLYIAREDTTIIKNNINKLEIDIEHQKNIYSTMKEIKLITENKTENIAKDERLIQYFQKYGVLDKDDQSISETWLKLQLYDFESITGVHFTVELFKNAYEIWRNMNEPNIKKQMGKSIKTTTR